MRRRPQFGDQRGSVKASVEPYRWGTRRRGGVEGVRCWGSVRTEISPGSWAERIGHELGQGANKTKCFLVWLISTRKVLPSLTFAFVRSVRNRPHGLETHHEVCATNTRQRRFGECSFSDSGAFVLHFILLPSYNKLLVPFGVCWTDACVVAQAVSGRLSSTQARFQERGKSCVGFLVGH